MGKSTLFNALLKKQQAYVANFPFATIEPNIGIVPVPDGRLKKLAEIVKEEEKMDFLPPEMPATVEFVDIAGLIAGASKGEGLGNKFLSHIREVSAICHVLRAFSDPEVVKEGTVNPQADLEVVETELKLADLQTLENQEARLKSQTVGPKFKSAVGKLKEALAKGVPAREVILDDQERQEAKQLSLLTAKPVLVVLNIDEADLKKASLLEREFAQSAGLNFDQVIAVSAKIESELSELSEEEQKAYLKDLEVESSGLERLIRKAFTTLGLITFLTAGKKEVRAWTIRNGTKAQEAAGEIHSDFVKNFIKAEVIGFDDFVAVGGWKEAREKGKVRSEGRDYQVQDGDVIEFKIGS